MMLIYMQYELSICFRFLLERSHCRSVLYYKYSLEENNYKINKINCIIDGIKILLKNNYSTFGDNIYVIYEGGGIGPKFMPFYTDLAMVKYDNLVIKYCKDLDIKLIKYLRYRDDMNLKIEGENEEQLKLKMNVLIKKLETVSIRIKFKMEFGGKNNNFLDVKEKIIDNKIELDLYSKPTNTYSFLLKGSFHPNITWGSVPNGVGHRLRTICDDKYLLKNLLNHTVYLMNRGYEMNEISKKFIKYLNISKEEILKNNQNKYFMKFSKYINYKEKNFKQRTINKNNNILLLKNKENDKKINDDAINPIWITYIWDSRLPDIKKIIKKHYYLLGENEELKKLYPLNIFRFGYKVNEKLVVKLHPNKQIKQNGDMCRYEKKEKGNKCCRNKNCKSCNEIYDGKDEYSSKQYGFRFKIKYNYNCNSSGVIYCVECIECGEQYIGSTMVNVKKRMNGHRHDIKVNNGGCGTAKHFNMKCKKWNDDKDYCENFRFYVIDHIDDMGETEEERKWADKQLCIKERKYQARVGTIFNGMNGTVDWYNYGNNRRNWKIEKEEIKANVKEFK